MQARGLLLSVVVAVAAASPALGQASIPDLSGMWTHPFLNGLEPPLSGPGPVRNKVRRTGPQAGTSSIYQLVGDYTNPILQPWAADVVKRLGDGSFVGNDFPTPRNQCWPEQVPFVFINYGMQLLQQGDRITILYPFDHQFRQIRLNEPHPAHVTPSWYGDSVGRYESNALVVDTVGVKVGPLSMIDWFGTPFTQALHLVERYRLLDYDATMRAIARAAKEHAQNDTPYNGPAADPGYKGPGAQIELTVEDSGAFTMPWTATITFRRSAEEWRERVCAENVQWNPGTTSTVPTASKPDF
jgi:hypothetical protein